MGLPDLLISTDFDGTLLDHNLGGPLAPEFFDWLEAARCQRRVVWVINTGRHWESLREELEWRQARCQPDWVILIEREIHRLSSNGHSIPLTNWNTTCTQVHADLFERADGTLDMLRKDLRRFPGLQIISDVGSPLGLIAISEKQADEVQIALEPLFEAFPEIHTVRNSVYFRFAHVDYHKGSCLGVVLSETGIHPENCFAAGDHLNDLPMLDHRYARYLACPSNAIPEVKERVSKHQGYVASQPAGRGIADALNHFFPVA